MGATTFLRSANGKSPEDAYENAYETAESETGHRDGYSGDLTSKNGFVFAETPKGVQLSVWIKALRDDDLPKSLLMHSEEFQRQQEIYDDKWGPALSFEVVENVQKGTLKRYIFVGSSPE